MRIAPTFNVALRALRRNKMRSVLTALGIIIGVGAVIAMVGIGNGAKAQVEAQIASLGQNVILILSGNVTRGGFSMGFGRVSGVGKAGSGSSFGVQEPKCFFTRSRASVFRTSPAMAMIARFGRKKLLWNSTRSCRVSRDTVISSPLAGRW